MLRCLAALHRHCQLRQASSRVQPESAALEQGTAARQHARVIQLHDVASCTQEPARTGPASDAGPSPTAQVRPSSQDVVCGDFLGRWCRAFFPLSSLRLHASPASGVQHSCDCLQSPRAPASAKFLSLLKLASCVLHSEACRGCNQPVGMCCSHAQGRPCANLAHHSPCALMCASPLSTYVLDASNSTSSGASFAECFVLRRPPRCQQLPFQKPLLPLRSSLLRPLCSSPLHRSSLPSHLQPRQHPRCALFAGLEYERASVACSSLLRLQCGSTLRRSSPPLHSQLRQHPRCGFATPLHTVS